VKRSLCQKSCLCFSFSSRPTAMRESGEDDVIVGRECTCYPKLCKTVSYNSIAKPFEYTYWTSRLELLRRLPSRSKVICIFSFLVRSIAYPTAATNIPVPKQPTHVHHIRNFDSPRILVHYHPSLIKPTWYLGERNGNSSRITNLGLYAVADISIIFLVLFHSFSWSLGSCRLSWCAAAPSV